MNRISRHCFNLCQYLFQALQHMQYANGRKVVKLYQDTDFSSIERQGGAISFNIMHDDGSYVGFAEINCMANIHNIIVRTGCFCNPGACQRQLDLTNDEVKKHFQVRNNIHDEIQFNWSDRATLTSKARERVPLQCKTVPHICGRVCFG